MIGTPYLIDLFKSILTKSKVINGRFYCCPFWGQELNKGNIEEIIQYVETKQPKDQKYPAALLMPFRTVGNFQYSGLNNIGQAGWSHKEITMVFVCNSQTTGQNQTTTPAVGTGKSTHTTQQTWHDMERCAVDFMAVLYNVIFQNNLQGTVNISESYRQEILQVTNKANDQVTGVLLRFQLDWASGCDIEDYPDNYLSLIVPPDPTIDVHPLHTDI